ncbi:MAG TPA: Lrp/AsnC family transcriptional regulator [Thermoanaerobaculia bacterium]|nr:Lrp/AsnC family transcriptional regulator [Thermoanaerobaculia bacterium]
MADSYSTIDGKDIDILSLVQSNARISNAQIARQVGMAPSAILERLRKLEARGVVRGYETRLDPHPLGLGLLAFVFVRSDERLNDGETAARLAEIPEAQEVHHVAGEDCYLVKVRAADPEALGRLLRERFGSIPSVRSTRTTIVLGTVKESGQLPLPEPESLETSEVADA